MSRWQDVQWKERDTVKDVTVEIKKGLAVQRCFGAPLASINHPPIVVSLVSLALCQSVNTGNLEIQIVHTGYRLHCCGLKSPNGPRRI